MKFSTFVKLVASGQSALMFRLLKTSNEFYRTCFVSTALSHGIYGHFIEGKADIEHLCEKLGISDREGLLAWLELGVSLGELRHAGNGYEIKGALSRALLKDDNDGYRALLEEIARYHYPYVMETPAMLKRHARFPFDETPGELVARSSRVSEPFIFEAVDSVVPCRGSFELLEVGCGSGTYIQHACKRNPAVRAVGLELQERVAQTARKNIQAWGLASRVTIEHCDVLKYSSSRKFDLVTLHQNIYYFPVAERAAMARHVLEYLKPGGKVLVTTICQGGGPAMQAVNIWVSTTEGYGPMPNPDQLCEQFREAGFTEVTRRRLVPFEGFWAFVASKKVPR